MQTNTEEEQATCGIEESDGEKPDVVVCTQKHMLVSTSLQHDMVHVLQYMYIVIQLVLFFPSFVFCIQFFYTF